MNKLIAKERLKHGTRLDVMRIRKEFEGILNRKDVCQIDSRYPEFSKILEKHTSNMPSRDIGNNSLLMFRRVAEHDDDWSHVYVNGKRRAPAFIHKVIHGSMKLRVGRSIKEYKSGDVFVMDMNKKHEVITNRLCITAVVTVAKTDYMGRNK